LSEGNFSGDEEGGGPFRVDSEEKYQTPGWGYLVTPYQGHKSGDKNLPAPDVTTLLGENRISLRQPL
jgi:hypothetical protein